MGPATNSGFARISISDIHLVLEEVVEIDLDVVFID